MLPVRSRTTCRDCKRLSLHEQGPGLQYFFILRHSVVEGSLRPALVVQQQCVKESDKACKQRQSDANPVPLTGGRFGLSSSCTLTHEFSMGLLPFS